MKLIEYQKKNKKVNALIGIPVLLEKSKNKDIVIDNYIKDSFAIDNYIVKKNRLPFNLLIEYNKHYCLVTGCGVSSAELVNAKEFTLTKKEQIKYKYLLNYIFNNKYPDKEKCTKQMNLNDMNYIDYQEYCKKVFNTQINDLFELIIEHIKIDYPLYNSIYEKLNLIKNSNEFNSLPLEISNEEARKGSISKTIIIKQLFIMLKCNSKNANLEKLNETVKFNNRVGRISGVNIASATIINRSVTGLKEIKYEF